MKDRNTTPAIVISIIVVLLVGGYLLLKLYMPKYNWEESLNYKNDEPYGNSILYEIIKNSYDEEDFVEIEDNSFKQSLDDNPRSDYIFIGTRYYIDSVNVSTLIKHIKKGNKAFISVTNLEMFLSVWLKDTLSNMAIDVLTTDSINVSKGFFNNYRRKYTKSLYADSITTELKYFNYGSDSIYTFYYKYLKKTRNYNWQYFNSHFFNSIEQYSPVIISTINKDKPNFVSLKVGEGRLYLHQSPIFLSNYHLLKEETFFYLKNVLKDIDSESIIWDNYSYYYHPNKNNQQLRESSLRFILKHKSLRLAWYTLLTLVILFIIIQSKRKQNVIPLKKVKKNNTLDYAKAIGALYFQAKSHKAITDEMINQLYSFIKTRYSIKITKDKKKITPRLAKMSGIKEETIEELFKNEIEVKYNKDATSDQLYKLYSLVDYFYKNCN